MVMVVLSLSLWHYLFVPFLVFSSKKDWQCLWPPLGVLVSRISPVFAYGCGVLGRERAPFICDPTGHILSVSWARKVGPTIENCYANRNETRAMRGILFIAMPFWLADRVVSNFFVSPFFFISVGAPEGPWPGTNGPLSFFFRTSCAPIGCNPARTARRDTKTQTKKLPFS